MPKPYQKYKPSNISWVGEIPDHWVIKKVKYFSYLKGRIGFHGLKSSEFIEEGPYLVTGTDFLNGKINWNSCYHITEERYWEDTHIHLRDGDLLITKDGTIGKTAIVENKPSKATLNSGVLLIRPTQSFIKTFFFYYCLNSDLFNRQIDFLKRGTTINHLYQETFANFVFIAPSTEEQQQIASYLDSKTQKIDKLISNKQKQIELLKEERQAVINNAVTGKVTSRLMTGHSDPELSGEESNLPRADYVADSGAGVDGGVARGIGGGNVADATAAIAAAHAAAQAAAEAASKSVKYKPSGIPWLGDIPEHWAVKKLKYNVYKVSSGVTPEGGASVYTSEGIPFLRSQNVHFDGLKLDDIAFISEEIDNKMKNSRIASGDVLLNITGASIGRCYYIEPHFGKGNVNQHVCIIRPNGNKLLTKYLYFFLSSDLGQLQIDFYQMGANREGLNFEQIRNFFLTIPSIEEQLKIIAYIEEELKANHLLVSKIEKEILLLQEYRTALISEVVTGKIDVREELVS